MIIRKHERDYADIRVHLRRDHGVQAIGVVRLATFMRHRRLHTKAHAVVPHTHEERV